MSQLRFATVEDFEQWRGLARQFLSEGVAPDGIQWNGQSEQPGLFGDSSTNSLQAPEQEKQIQVSKSFVDLARQVACHREPRRWHLLYRTLWRLTHGEKHLLKITTDDDVLLLTRMQKAVSRDVHKMKAFVRFRKTTIDDLEHYVAWHRPDHRIVRLAAAFFSRRFKAMNWSILTPHESVHWNQSELRYGPGVPAREAADVDDLEELWKTYYASIFNPARVKVSMMKSEMPVRHWPTLPETELIPQLLRRASGRVDTMIENTEGFAQTAVDYMPPELSLPAMRSAVQHCRACELCENTTQAVFGDGDVNANMVLVGEQPGDQEDLAGKPFVGPAGAILLDALAAADLTREDVYLTNTVKHFKFVEQSTQRGKHRLHKKPSSREIYACRPWLESELTLIQPRVLVCLGATAAQALMGRDFRITESRGKVVSTEWCRHTIASWHPAAILRMVDDNRRREMRHQLESDLKAASELV